MNWIGATFGQNEANFTMAHVELDDMRCSRLNNQTRCWSAWDWGLVGQWKLKLTAPCCCIGWKVKEDRLCCSTSSLCQSESLKEKTSINLYTLPGILQWLSTLPKTNDYLHIHYEVSTFWVGAILWHLASISIFWRILPQLLRAEEIHQFVVQAADAMQLAWPPAPESFQELPRPMQSRVDEGWFQRPEQKQGKNKGMVCFHGSLWVEDWSKDGWKVMKLWFSTFHMEHGYYIADSYWKGKGAVFFPNVNMHCV